MHDNDNNGSMPVEEVEGVTAVAHPGHRFSHDEIAAVQHDVLRLLGDSARCVRLTQTFSVRYQDLIIRAEVVE